MARTGPSDDNPYDSFHLPPPMLQKDGHDKECQIWAASGVCTCPHLHAVAERLSLGPNF
jgi:hypothetical protein